MGLTSVTVDTPIQPNKTYRIKSTTSYHDDTLVEVSDYVKTFSLAGIKPYVWWSVSQKKAYKFPSSTKAQIALIDRIVSAAVSLIEQNAVREHYKYSIHITLEEVQDNE